MRFGLVHRLMTDALAALGVLALAASGLVAPRTTAFLVALLALAIAMPDRWRQRRALAIAGAVLPIAIVALLVLAVMGGGHPILAALIEALAGVIITRVATRRGAEQDTTLLVTVLVAFATASILGGGIACALCILGACLVVPGALVLSLLRREVEGNYRQGARDRTGHPVDVARILRSRRVVGRGFLAATVLVGGPIVIVAGALFVALPRWTPTITVRTDRIDLSRSASTPSDVIALRFQVEPGAPTPARMPLRLRGGVLDVYDRGTWQRSETSSLGPLDLPPRDVSRSAGSRWITIEREPTEPSIVFTPPATIAIAASFPIDRLSGGELRGSIDEARYDVLVSGDRAPTPEPLVDGARYLALPSSISPRVRELGRTWSHGEPPMLAARAIESHLKKDFTYDLFSPSRGTSAPLEHFLFESGRGHCELFATAMAVMLRDEGIPARVVIGFFGGTYNAYGGYYVVREREAHAWVEAYVGGAWTTFDPTPSMAAPPPLETGALASARDIADASAHRFAKDVLRYGPRHQTKILDHLPGVRWVAFAIATLGGAILVAFAVRRRRSRARETLLAANRPRQPSAELYEDLEEALLAHGIARDPALPPLAHAEALVAKGHPLAAEVLALTNVYLEARFGGALLDRDARRAFTRRVHDLQVLGAGARPWIVSRVRP